MVTDALDDSIQILKRGKPLRFNVKVYRFDLGEGLFFDPAAIDFYVVTSLSFFEGFFAR